MVPLPADTLYLFSSSIIFHQNLFTKCINIQKITIQSETGAKSKTKNPHDLIIFTGKV